MAEPLDTPERDPAELEAELQEYRRKERARALLDDARAGLKTRGLTESFAAFLVGADETETAKNLSEFERCWQDAVGAEVKNGCLPRCRRIIPPQSRRRAAAASAGCNTDGEEISPRPFRRNQKRGAAA